LLKAIWFFIQIAIIVGAAVWLYDQPGSIEIAVQDYTVSVKAGLFLLCLGIFITLALILYNLFNAILNVPRALSNLHARNKKQKGYIALTRGLTSVAAGDAKVASQYAAQTRRLLPEDKGLPILLEAQAARLRGDELQARKSFMELVENKDAGFLGLRGLLKSSLDEGNDKEALTYARKALAAYPKQGWILRTVYKLELKNHQWAEAQKTLKQAVKNKAIAKDEADKDLSVILYIEADQERQLGYTKTADKKLAQAYKFNPDFIPIAASYAQNCLDQGKKRKARKIIEACWKKNPHPDLVSLWDQLSPENKPTDPMRRLGWYEKLVALKPDSAEGQIAAAKAAMQDGFWEEARAYLNIAERIEPSARLYKLYAELEEETSHDDQEIRNWLKKAASAPASKVWYCRQTGHVYDRWMPIAPPHGSFNTIRWGYPEYHKSNDNVSGDLLGPDALMLEPVSSNS